MQIRAGVIGWDLENNQKNFLTEKRLRIPMGAARAQTTILDSSKSITLKPFLIPSTLNHKKMKKLFPLILLTASGFMVSLIDGCKKDDGEYIIADTGCKPVSYIMGGYSEEKGYNPGDSYFSGVYKYDNRGRVVTDSVTRQDSFFYGCMSITYGPSSAEIEQWGYHYSMILNAAGFATRTVYTWPGQSITTYDGTYAEDGKLKEIRCRWVPDEEGYYQDRHVLTLTYDSIAYDRAGNLVFMRAKYFDEVTSTDMGQITLTCEYLTDKFYNPESDRLAKLFSLLGMRNYLSEHYDGFRSFNPQLFSKNLLKHIDYDYTDTNCGTYYRDVTYTFDREDNVLSRSEHSNYGVQTFFYQCN